MYQPFSLIARGRRFEATSPGERLWRTLREWWADQEGADQVWSTFDWLDGRKRMGMALPSAAASDACFRLVARARAALKECDLTAAPADIYSAFVTDKVKQYCVSPMGFSALDRILPVIAHLAFQSAVVARNDIASTTRSGVYASTLRVHGRLSCYVCDLALSGGCPLDHVWPRSVGGVSDEENLLPICEPCNTRKGDRVSWDVFGPMLDYSLRRNSPEGSHLTNMALHRRAAMRLAEQETITLKDAFLRLGPIRPRSAIDPDERADWFFNINVHDLTVLPDLWD